MRVLILGGAGFLGQSLARGLGQRGRLRGKAIREIRLADIREAKVPAGGVKCTSSLLDLSDREAIDLRLGSGWDAIFHLATLAAAPAEANFALGMRSNFFGMFNLLESLRCNAPKVPVVLASWSGINGTDRLPQTSHGTQTAIGEMLVHDYTRRRMIDGRILRLPHVVARDDRAKHDIFRFLSDLIRAPLAGEPAMSKAGEDALVHLTSEQRAVENLILMAERDGADSGTPLDAPAIPTRLADLVAALDRATDGQAGDLIDFEPDATVEALATAMGKSTPAAQRRAVKAGLVGDADLDALVTSCAKL